MMSRALTEMAATQAFLPWSTCAALVMFFGFFAGMLVWTSLRSNRRIYEEVSQFPLRDDEVNS